MNKIVQDRSAELYIVKMNLAETSKSCEEYEHRVRQLEVKIEKIVQEMR